MIIVVNSYEVNYELLHEAGTSKLQDTEGFSDYYDITSTSTVISSSTTSSTNLSTTQLLTSSTAKGTTQQSSNFVTTTTSKTPTLSSNPEIAQQVMQLVDKINEVYVTLGSMIESKKRSTAFAEKDIVQLKKMTDILSSLQDYSILGKIKTSKTATTQ